MDKYSGHCIRGPKNGEVISSSSPKIEFPELTNVSIVFTDAPYDEAAVVRHHVYIWDDEYKYWVYQE